MQGYVDADQVEKIEGFLEQHCITCHNRIDKSGDRDFENIRLFQTDIETQLQLQEIIDQIKNNMNISLEKRSHISSLIGQNLSKSFKTLCSTYKLLIIDI